MTRRLSLLDNEDAAVAEAAAVIRAGGLVVFPTETVYGLGADARNDHAVARVFEAKGRPSFNPLIAHVAEVRAAEQIAYLSQDARRLAAAFWPGPLTLAAPRRDMRISRLATAGLDSVAVRVPADARARRLIAAAGGPVAAPSANRSGALSPTTADAAAEGLAGRVDLILDGGPCPVGVESTVVAVFSDDVRILREGGVTREAVERVLEREPSADPGGAADGAPRAPGQLTSHYAPRADLRLNADAPAPGEAWLGFGPRSTPTPTGPVRDLSSRGDLVEAAANLFSHLRALDAALGGAGCIAVAPIPEIGLGRAINDRLRRAAAPRS